MVELGFALDAVPANPRALAPIPGAVLPSVYDLSMCGGKFLWHTAIHTCVTGKGSERLHTEIVIAAVS